MKDSTFKVVSSSVASGFITVGLIAEQWKDVSYTDFIIAYAITFLFMYSLAHCIERWISRI